MRASSTSPTFFIIGYPKCATTSLHAYLEKRPQALGSTPKETQFFGRNGKCWHANNTLEPWGCGVEETANYIQNMMFRDDTVASGLTQAAFESTTDYSWGDPMGPAVMATGIRRELPWLKLIPSLREPISHEISGRVHTMEMLKKRPAWFRPGPADECLMQLEQGNATMYDCVRDLIKDKEGYIEAMAVWLATWPTEQFMIIQFENLTADASHTAVLNDVMRFVDIDPSKGPQELPQANSRKGDVNPEGWRMKKAEFMELLSYAQPLSERIAAMLERHGFYKADDWLAAWRASWKSNLDSCEATGICNVVLT
ncbi:hypothetical protein Rsub_13298 [Raphidocelis subcapitata]|uniref:Sulfotransferase n=1 Tax=Raphidocelis subcapitata TaxID=307507 RepID=A0A2V0PT75_9CHLO|nr:hypothetical protein Rsub_13298 [Raphidocelis subcapitata]|eukprot:GBG00586.1 hypothetical protein Rsub_13298 [Raphidocelis subcapitata]